MVSEVAKACAPAVVPAVWIAAICIRTSLPPDKTVTSSVPLNLPPVLARWLAIWPVSGRVISPIGEPVALLPGPTGLLTREPPWA